MSVVAPVALTSSEPSLTCSKVCSLTGQSFLIFAPSEGSAVVKRQRGGACQGAAMCGGFCHCSVDGGTFPADDVLPGALDRYRGDQRSEFLWRLPGWADDADEPHSDGPGGIRAANPAG